MYTMATAVLVMLGFVAYDWWMERRAHFVRYAAFGIEIPVNYTSRSFAEGKKVSFVRDGMTWISTILRYRLRSIGPGRVAWK